MENNEQLLSESESGSIDFRRYLSLFISNWYWFAGALFIALAIAYGVNRYGEEIYFVQSTILIKDEQFGGGYGSIDYVIPGGEAYKSQQNLQNEMGILKSFKLNLDVMNSLPDFHVNYTAVGKRGIAESCLYKYSPFMVVYDTVWVQPTGVRIDIRVTSPEKYTMIIEKYDYQEEHKFGERFRKFGFDFSLIRRPGGLPIYTEGGSNKYYFYFIDPIDLANAYRSKLNISPIQEEATLVALSVIGASEEQEADYLNMLMQKYIELGLEWKTEAAKNTITFIDGQIDVISDSLHNAESAKENFRLANRFVDLTTEGNLILQRLERYESEKTSLNLQLQYYEYLDNYLKSREQTGAIISPSAMGVVDPVLIKLVEDLSQMQKQQRQIGFVLKDQLPASDLISGKVEESRAELLENVNNGINQLRISLSDVNQRIAGVEQELDRLPGTERKMIRIERDYDLNNTVYNFLLEKRAEAGIASASNVSDNKIIDHAAAFNASMVKPRTRQNYLLALVLGLFLPAVAIVIIDMMNNKVIDKKDIEKLTKTPILGFVSHSSYDTEIPVISKPGSTLAESFRSIRTSLKYFIPGNKPMVVSISSTVSGEGKTFVAVNLAAIMSLLGKKTLLVGLDLRKPRIHRILGMDNTEGMSTYLSGNTSYADIIKKTSIDNLYYATSGPVPPNPAELIEREEMKAFLEEARKQFDFVIIDTPPVAIVTDALLLGHHSDMMLFVVRQRYSSKNTVNLIEEIYRNKEIKTPGIIVNDISMSGYYGYGLRYGYTMGYAYGYNYGYKYYGRSSYGRGSKDEGGEYYTDD